MADSDQRVLRIGFKSAEQMVSLDQLRPSVFSADLPSFIASGRFRPTCLRGWGQERVFHSDYTRCLEALPTLKGQFVCGTRTAITVFVNEVGTERASFTIKVRSAQDTEI